MTFNVENLFDTEDAPGKDDATFLPRTRKDNARHRAQCAAISVADWRRQCLEWDWNEAALSAKLARIAAVVLQVGDGRGPDILALQEVENRAVLERLRVQHLGAAGYAGSVLVEGDDPRGIDVAFLSRLPRVGSARLHRGPRRSGARGILEVTFELPDGTLLTGFNVHFPAPSHPFSTRVEALRHLNEVASTLPRERLRFAAGDFNITADEDARHGLIAQQVAPSWLVAHRPACTGCRGTHYSERHRRWSFLDMILLGPELAAESTGRWRLRPASVRVLDGVAVQRTARGRPAAFELPGPSGVSDHFPLVAELSRQGNPAGVQPGPGGEHPVE